MLTKCGKRRHIEQSLKEDQKLSETILNSQLLNNSDDDTSSVTTPNNSEVVLLRNDSERPPEDIGLDNSDTNSHYNLGYDSPTSMLTVPYDNDNSPHSTPSVESVLCKENKPSDYAIEISTSLITNL